MSTKTTIILSFSLIAIALLVSVILYARLPDPMPSHWNAAGEIDGYMSKFWGIFLMPIITVVLVPLFLIIPNIDPLKANIAKFRGVFNWFIVLFVAYMLFIYALTLAAALGYPVQHDGYAPAGGWFAVHRRGLYDGHRPNAISSSASARRGRSPAKQFGMRPTNSARKCSYSVAW